MRGLIYREWIHRKKKILLNLLVFAVLLILIVLVQFSFRYGNLRLEILGEDVYSILHPYLYVVSLVIPIFASSMLSKLNSDDIASGFARYSITLPAPVWKFTGARVIIVTLLNLIGMAYTFGTAKIVTLISGEPLSKLAVQGLLCALLFLQIASMYETVLSYLPFKHGINVAITTASEMLIYLALIFGVCYQKVGALVLDYVNRFQELNDQGIVSDSDIEALLTDILHDSVDKVTPFLNTVTALAPLIYIGASVLGFVCATLLLKWRRKKCGN